MSPASFYAEVYDLVRRIPPGRVTTYGAVARMLANARAARAVGYALRALPPGTDVPWQRVINAQGQISLKSRHPGETTRQRELLEQEGISFGADDRVDLDRYRWGAGAGPDD
jgi:methylated-DNA-protein-cysteine methyltransferase-like protein